MVLLETDPSRARRVVREALAPYLPLENYANNWRRLGYTDDDLAGGGSERLLDAVIAWGDETAIRARIQAHWDAGADHVCIQAIHPQSGRQMPDDRLLALLAPG
jgi:probable F420-dependent oxidoreductase